MRKKLPFILLSVLIFIQICVPVGMIVYNRIDSTLAETKGEKFRFRVENIIYDNGGYVHFNTKEYNHTSDITIYAEVKVDDNGYADLYLTKKRPDSDYYVKSQYKDGFYFPVPFVITKDYPFIGHRDFYKNHSDTYTPTGVDNYYNEAYIEAYVYKGRVGKLVLYIDGLEAEEYFANLNAKLESLQ